MKSDEQHFLFETFNWNSEATFTLMQHGENDTYLVHTTDGKYAVRRYRQNRYTLGQVRAELAWLDMFRKSIHVPEIIKNRSGGSVSRYSDSTGDTLYVAFEFIDGDTILHPTESDYEKLGRFMRSLHDSADEVFNKVTVDWDGWNRPEFDLYRTVEEPLRRLRDFEPLTKDDKDRCNGIAQELTRRFKCQDASRHFIHADLHFGNILATPNGWFCLDFDECGFGNRVLDIGVIRLHIRAAGQQGQSWEYFKKGYGTEFSDEEARLGTALRIFFMTGKIPIRQDIEDLRHKPEDRIRRYLGYIESEIHDSMGSGSPKSFCVHDIGIGF